MKNLFIGDLKRRGRNDRIEALGWITRINDLKNHLFLDLTDSTGTIQVVIDKNRIKKIDIKNLSLESSVSVLGKKNKKNGKLELIASKVSTIGTANKQFYPSIRGDFDIFSKNFNKFLGEKRHIFIRNPKMVHILKMRHATTNNIRNWFNTNNFFELTAPILTPTILYDPNTALKVRINGRNAFLTQCVGFYLEASVYALERVYNIGPSFRGQESHTKRHLMEYWHVKSEMAFADLEDMIKSVEKLISYISRRSLLNDKENRRILDSEVCLDGLKTPYPRIRYEDAIKYLKEKGSKIKFGDRIGSEEERLLSGKFKNTPFWITGNPRTLEPFPYCLDSEDPRVLRVADLIASNGYGELLGVAEKMTDGKMLLERMKEKGKHNDKSYKWVKELQDYGVVPHAAMGMGLERLIRWIFNIPHVKYTIPFPRTFRAQIYP